MNNIQDIMYLSKNTKLILIKNANFFKDLSFLYLILLIDKTYLDDVLIVKKFGRGEL